LLEKSLRKVDSGAKGERWIERFTLDTKTQRHQEQICHGEHEEHEEEDGFQTERVIVITADEQTGIVESMKTTPDCDAMNTRFVKARRRIPYGSVSRPKRWIVGSFALLILTLNYWMVGVLIKAGISEVYLDINHSVNIPATILWAEGVSLAITMMALWWEPSARKGFVREVAMLVVFGGLLLVAGYFVM